jgi:hypothetical protein
LHPDKPVVMRAGEVPGAVLAQKAPQRSGIPTEHEVLLAVTISKVRDSMPPKSGKSEIELKVNIPRPLMEKLNEFRHANRFETRKEAVISILTKVLEATSEPSVTAVGKSPQQT